MQLSFSVWDRTLLKVHAFFISNTWLKFYKQGQAQIGKQSKRHPEAELSLFEIFLFLYPRYHPKIITDIIRNVQKTTTCA